MLTYVYMCERMFANVSKEEDEEDQLGDCFVSATIQTATGNEQSTVIICISLPRLLPCCYYSENVYHAEMSRTNQSLQLHFLEGF